MNKIKVTELEPARAQMAKMGFTPEKFEKEALFACSIWNDPKNGYLRKSTTNSLIQSLVNVAQTSLTLNPVAKEAFLIPRKDGVSNQILCTLEPSYVGLVKLLTDAGSVTSINTQLVYENDSFDVDFGRDQPVIHKPDLGNRGDIIGCYSIAKLTTGEKQVEWMELEEIKKIRETSESYKAYLKDKSKHSIWNTSFGEMCRKTVLKRIYKYLPRTDRMQQFDNAVKLTNRDWEASTSQIAFAETLIGTSTIIESRKEQLYKELATCDSNGVEMMIDYLQDHQLKPGIESDIHSEKEAADLTMEAVARDNDPELFEKSE